MPWAKQKQKKNNLLDGRLYLCNSLLVHTLHRRLHISPLLLRMLDSLHTAMKLRWFIRFLKLNNWKYSYAYLIVTIELCNHPQKSCVEPPRMCFPCNHFLWRLRRRSFPWSRRLWGVESRASLAPISSSLLHPTSLVAECHFHVFFYLECHFHAF